MPHICVIESGWHWFRYWLVAYTASSHYLKQCWNIVNWTLRNKLQWNFNRNSNIFTQENVFESIVCNMAAILSRKRWVYTFSHMLLLLSCMFSNTDRILAMSPNVYNFFQFSFLINDFVEPFVCQMKYFTKTNKILQDFINFTIYYDILPPHGSEHKSWTCKLI